MAVTHTLGTSTIASTLLYSLGYLCGSGLALTIFRLGAPASRCMVEANLGVLRLLAGGISVGQLGLRKVTGGAHQLRLGRTRPIDQTFRGCCFYAALMFSAGADSPGLVFCQV